MGGSEPWRARAGLTMASWDWSHVTNQDPIGSPMDRLLGIILGRPKVCLVNTEQGGVITKYSRTDLVGYLACVWLWDHQGWAESIPDFWDGANPVLCLV